MQCNVIECMYTVAKKFMPKNVSFTVEAAVSRLSCKLEVLHVKVTHQSLSNEPRTPGHLDNNGQHRLDQNAAN